MPALTSRPHRADPRSCRIACRRAGEQRLVRIEPELYDYLLGMARRTRDGLR